jgi:hypothetical protein
MPYTRSNSSSRCSLDNPQKKPCIQLQSRQKSKAFSTLELRSRYFSIRSQSSSKGVVSAGEFRRLSRIVFISCQPGPNIARAATGLCTSRKASEGPYASQKASRILITGTAGPANHNSPHRVQRCMKRPALSRRGWRSKMCLQFALASFVWQDPRKRAGGALNYQSGCTTTLKRSIQAAPSGAVAREHDW